MQACATSSVWVVDVYFLPCQSEMDTEVQIVESFTLSMDHAMLRDSMQHPVEKLLDGCRLRVPPGSPHTMAMHLPHQTLPIHLYGGHGMPYCGKIDMNGVPVQVYMDVNMRTGRGRFLLHHLMSNMVSHIYVALVPCHHC